MIEDKINKASKFQLYCARLKYQSISPELWKPSWPQ